MNDLFPLLKKLLILLSRDPERKAQLQELRGIALRTFVWIALTELAMIGQFYPIKLFFDEYQAGSDRMVLLAIAGAILFLGLVANILHAYMDNHRNTMTWAVWSILWGNGHRHHLRLDTAWHVEHSTGEKDSVLAKNMHRVEVLIDEWLFTVVPGALHAAILCVGMWLLGWQFGVVALGTFVGYAIIVYINEKAISPLREHFRKQLKHIERDGNELIQNWRTVKQFGIEEQQSDEHDNLLSQFRKDEIWRHKTFRTYAKRQDDFLAVGNGFLYAIIVAPFVPFASIGSVALAGSWMQRLYMVARMFNQFQQRMNEGIVAFRELIEILEMQPAVRQAEKPIWKEEWEGAVEFRSVSFSYPAGKQDALQGVSFSLPPNQTVALVGHSGSGKSTIASLLMREYDPDKGAIFIDGVDIREIDYPRYRNEMLGIVTQDVQLFDGSVRENIRVGKADAPGGVEYDAAKKAYADEFIETLAGGYDAQIGEDGIRLSGGQRQRLAIARALLKNPRILILDEATSSLDAISQERVQRAIDEIIAARQSTLFVIAHRFSTIMRADLVVVLDNGKVVEIGTHQDLERQNGIYKCLKDLETKRVLEEDEN